MTTVTLKNTDNMLFETSRLANLIYGDMIYENATLDWIRKYWMMLAPNSIFQVQTDYHTAAQVKLFLDSMPGAIFINEIIYKQEWGGTPRRGFPMKHDNIFIYANGDDWYWDASKIQIAKKTAGTAFDKKGTGMKTPCSVFDDIGNFSTMSKERVKGSDGRNIQWQKPFSLMRRLMTPFLKPGDLVIDPFCGSGTTLLVANELGCDSIGLELERETYNICKKRLEESGLFVA
jgi:DNA modification methylase